MFFQVLYKAHHGYGWLEDRQVLIKTNTAMLICLLHMVSIRTWIPLSLVPPPSYILYCCLLHYISNSISCRCRVPRVSCFSSSQSHRCLRLECYRNNQCPFSCLFVSLSNLHISTLDPIKHSKAFKDEKQIMTCQVQEVLVLNFLLSQKC